MLRLDRTAAARPERTAALPVHTAIREAKLVFGRSQGRSTDRSLVDFIAGRRSHHRPVEL